MVEVPKNQYSFSIRLLRLLAGLLAGGTLAQALGVVVAHHAMDDSQAAGMIAHLIIQHLSYYFLGCAFIILSLSNILIKRGATQLKSIRLPSLMLISSVTATSFLLIPRMDYLRETALQDGMPVMASSFAKYFVILDNITLLLLCMQILSSALVVWRLTRQLSETGA